MNNGTIPKTIQDKLEQIKGELEKFSQQDVFKDIRPSKNGRVVRFFTSGKNELSLKIKFSPAIIKILSVHGNWKSSLSFMEKIVRSNGRI